MILSFCSIPHTQLHGKHILFFSAHNFPTDAETNLLPHGATINSSSLSCLDLLPPSSSSISVPSKFSEKDRELSSSRGSDELRSRGAPEAEDGPEWTGVYTYYGGLL